MTEGKRAGFVEILVPPPPANCDHGGVLFTVYFLI